MLSLAPLPDAGLCLPRNRRIQVRSWLKYKYIYKGSKLMAVDKALAKRKIQEQQQLKSILGSLAFSRRPKSSHCARGRFRANRLVDCLMKALGYLSALWIFT